MKGKFRSIGRVVIALTLVLSLSLVVAVPVYAAANATGQLDATNPAPATVYPGQQVIVFGFEIVDGVADGGLATLLERLTLTQTGTSVDADVASIELWEDVDDDAAITVADTQLGATSVLTGGAVTFGTDGVTMSTVADTTTKDYLVRVTVANAPVLTGTIIIDIALIGDYDVDVAGTTMAAGVLTGSAMTIDCDIAITDVAIADSTPQPGDTNVAVQRLTFTEPGSPNAVNVSTVKVSNVGSDAYVDKVALWEDVDDDGAFEPTGDDITGLLGSGTFTSGAITFGTLGLTLFDIPAVAGVTAQNVFVVYDISSSAPDGAQFRSRIVNPILDVTYDVARDTSAVPVTSTNPQTVTTAIAIADAANNPVGGTIGVGVTNFAVQAFTITDSGTGTDIDVVSIDRAPGATAVFGTDVTKVSLWKDDGDGLFDAASDTLLGSDTTPTNAATTIGAANVVLTSLAASEIGTFWITVDTSATATAALTIGTLIGDAVGDISVTATSRGTELDAVNPLASGGFYAITRAITIATSNDPAAGTVGAGQTNVLVQGFTVIDSGNTAGTDIDVVSIDETGSTDFGTLTTSDVTKVSLWRDNGDGVFDVNSDTLLGSDTTPAATSTIGTADVVLTNVANAATVQFWVTVDVQATCTAGTPTDTQTIVTRVGDAVGDISVTATSQGQQLAGANTLASTNPQTIDRNIVAANAAANPAAGTTGVGQSNVLIKAFTVTDSGNAAGSNIDVVSIDETGSATFGSASTTDVSKVSLWRDNGDGAFNAASDTLLGEDTTPAVTSTIGTPNVVLTNIADGATVTFFITVDVRGAAVDTRTIILSVDDAITDISMTATSQGLQLFAGDVNVLVNNAQTIDRNITILNNAAFNPVVANIGVGRTDVLIHAFDVTDSGNAAGTDIDIVSIDEINTAVFGTDVTKVSLWLDAGTAGFQGTAVDTLLGEDTTPGATSTIGSNDVVLVNVPDGTTITLFITVDIPSTATDARIIQTRVGDAITDISVTSTSQGLQLAGASIQNSFNKTIDLNVALANPATIVPAALATTGRGATNVLVQEFTVTDSGNGGGTQIDTVSIDRDTAAGATANFATDLTKVSLWLDTGVAGWQGPGVDTLLGENTSPSNTATVIGTADTVLLDLAQGQIRTLFVTVDTSTAIPTGAIIRTVVGNQANDVSVTSTSIGQGNAITGGFNSDNPVTVANNMAIAAGPSNPVAQSLAGGQTDVLVQAFRLTGALVVGGTDIDTITIERTAGATGDWAGDPGVVTNIDVTKLSLWRDEGAAGFQGTGVDTLLGSSTSPLSVGTTFGTVGTVLTQLDSGQAVQFLVTADIAADADDDATLQTTIGDEVADITVTATSPGAGLAAPAVQNSLPHTIHQLTSAATLSASYTQGSTVVVRVDARGAGGGVFAGTVTVETDEPAGTVLALDDGAGYDGTAADGIFYAQFLTQFVGAHSGTVYMNGIAKATIAYTTSSTVTLGSISATPESVTLSVDGTQQLTVTATYSDASTANVTATASYVSSAPSVATVSNAGLITAVAEGSATITVSYETKTAEVSVTVSEEFDVYELYDADGDGVISKTEALTAVADYFDSVITKAQALQVIVEYMG